MNGLLTDLYQLTMAAGYYESGHAAHLATFELFVRRLPENRNFLVAAGLEQVVDYLVNLQFTKEEIDYLRGLPQFASAPPGFFDSLASFRFTGDLYAVREGTPVFPGEPILTIRAPLIEAQIPETYVLATVAFETMIATKAARTVEAAGGRAVIEFGSRRAHSPAAGVLAGRAAYIGGCTGTSNTQAGFLYGVPVFGTNAHSWVQSFTSEVEAFRQLQQLLGPNTAYLIDTYDTLEGARRAAQHAIGAEVRLYDRLFTVEHPDGGKEGDWLTNLNPGALTIVADAKLEPSLASAVAGERFQFERQGYFCVDPDTAPGRLVFNRTVTLRDTWAKIQAGPGR